MKVNVPSIIIFVMGSNLVLAGTYGTDYGKQNKDSVENYENYPKKEEKSEPKILEHSGHEVKGIYTRTIVWPVSYSFISANVHAPSKEEESPRKDDLSENESSSEESQNPENIDIQNGSKNFKLLVRPVLQGNMDELNEKDLTQKPKQETESGLERPYLGNESYKPVTEPSLEDTPLVTEYSHEVKNFTEHPPPNRYKNNRNIRHRNVYLRQQTSATPVRNEKRAFFQKTIQPLETIPEVLLHPPPQPLRNRRIPSIQTGEYRNVNHENHHNLPVEKDTRSLLNRKKAPWQSSNSDQYERVPKVIQAAYFPKTEEDTEDSEEEVEENSDISEDLNKSESGHKKHKKVKPKNSKSSAGSDYIEHHEGKKTEKGEKGYKKDSKHEKAEKGHHKKEGHQGEYKEEKGQEKKQHKGEKVYGEHHKGEKGKKAKKYGEGKKHKKGHSTHGEHNIIKKDEYIKKTKFYDEDHGGGEEEEHGEFQGQSAEKKGGKEEAGHSEKGYHKQDTSKKGHHDKGHHDEEHSGYEHEDGSDKHAGYEEEYEDKKGNKASKKWEKKEK